MWPALGERESLTFPPVLGSDSIPVMSVPIVTAEDVRRALRARDEIALLDVREEGAFADGHPLFAASLPIGRLEADVLDRIPRLSTRVVVYDGGEGLVADAVETLGALGYH